MKCETETCERTDSPFYPPRARWSARFSRAWFAVRRAVRAETLRDKTDELLGRRGLTLRRYALSLLVPGYSFGALGRRRIGRGVGLAYALSALVVVLWLGFPVASLAVGLMISLHVTSILFLPSSDLSLAKRLVYALAVLFVVSQLVYLPTRRFVENHLFLPLRLGEQVVIVNVLKSPGAIHRGDSVAYRIAAGAGQGFAIREGFALDKVLAVSGDRVVYSGVDLKINGVSRPRQPHMPVSGERIVPQKCWFLWPSLTISREGPATDALVAAQMDKLSLVSESAFVGKPFARWFWRRQVMP
ncbi:MAG: hypothetical protein HYY24_24585 [Verrucomicrobia bacterium]|nr:hypothetical protein [Verrucomicrobiota bacterium]